MLLQLCCVYRESLIANSIAASYSLPVLIPLCHSRSFFSEAIARAWGNFHFCFASPQTPFTQGSYKEPPYPAKTNSIEEVETNAFVFELYLVPACLHRNAVSHETCELNKSIYDHVGSCGNPEAPFLGRNVCDMDHVGIVSLHTRSSKQTLTLH